MAKTEMTRVQALATAIDLINDYVDDPRATEAVAVLAHMKEQLAKPKAKGEPTVSKTRLDNEATVRALYAKVGTEPFDGKYVIEHTTAMTPQKVVGIMKAGIELGLFEKFKDGKQTLYYKVG